MSSTLYKRQGTTIRLPNNTGVDLSAKKGYAAIITSSTVDLVSTPGIGMFGVILDGEIAGGRSTVAPFHNSPGTVPVKLNATPGTVTPGVELSVTASGDFKAAASTEFKCAVAMESGAGGEIIEAVLFKPGVTSANY